MKIVNPTHNKAALRQHIRQWVPPSNRAEMVCSALKDDVDLNCRVAVDERGVAGAVSFMHYGDRTHVFSLGSLRKGAGSALLSHVEQIAAGLAQPVTVSATITSEGFYAKHGFKRKRGQNSTASIIEMRKAK